MRSLEDLINFNDAHADIEFAQDECCQQVLPALILEVNISILLNRFRPPALIPIDIERRSQIALDLVRRKASMQFFRNTISTALSFQVQDMPQPPLLSLVSMFTDFRLIVGYPMVTVPLGILSKSGDPFGLSFIGTKFSEPTLIRLMSAYEASFPPRAMPLQLLPNAMKPLLHV